MEPEPMPSFPEQALSEHGSFVRRLARKLLADAHLADDVAQEAWSRYFAAPPTSANPRGWLARTVRNLATNTLRARSRRAEHEQRGARPEPARCGADEAEQAELLRTLVEAVLALEPTQRDTLLALYFRGLDAKTLALESGVPEPTVRDRQRRALATLRQRLDGKFGDKRAWGAALARLAGPPEVAPMPLGLGALAAAAGIVALGSLGVAAWASAGFESEAPAQTASSSAGVTVSESSAPEEPEPAVNSSSREAPTLSEATPLGGGSDDEEQLAVESAVATVRGRFVTSAGSPLAGIAFELKLGGLERGTGIPLDPPRPSDWEDLTGESDADGRFEVLYQSVPYYGQSFSAGAPGLSSISWDADELENGDVHDFGEVVLYRTATVFGRIVDGSGVALTGIPWQLSATPTSEMLARSMYRRTSCESDPLQATYRLEGLLPGLDRILLRSATSDHQTIDLELSEGEVIEHDLVYRGADPLSRIAVSLSMARLRAATSLIEASSLRLKAADGRQFSAHEPANAAGFLFEGLARDTLYTFEVADPRFEFVRIEGLSGGQVVRPELRGNSALVLTVMDGVTQEPAATFSSEVELRNVNFYPRSFPASKEGEVLPGGRVERCVAGDYVVRVEAAGKTGEVLVDNLAPGESRFVTVELRAGIRLEGRVVDEAGSPLVGLEVLAVRPAELDDGEDSMLARMGHQVSPPERARFEIASSRTDPEGRFLLELRKAELVLMRAADAFGTIPLGEPLVLAPGEDRTGLEFRLPRTGGLRGLIRTPDGRDPSGLRVAVVWNPGDTVELLDPIELDSNGTFALDGLRAGPYRVYLRTPEQGRFRSNGGSTSWTGESTCFDESGLWNSRLLGDVVIAAGQDSTPEFQVSAAHWPGTLELTLRVDEKPAKEWDVRLFQQGDCDLESSSDAQGVVGLTLFPGEWLLEITDPHTGWTHAFPDPIVVQALQVTRQVLEVERP